VNCRRRWARPCRALAWPVWRSRRASSGWSPPSATARSGVGSTSDAIRPWQHRCWIFPRDPQFEVKA
jgi:hypothetical protein